MLKLRVPSYRCYKPRNLAFVELSGKRHYLGPYGSPESKHAYQELTREWLVGKKQPPPGHGVVMVELIANYLDHLEEYYGPMTDRRNETYNHRPVLTVLKDNFGDTLVNEFDTLALVRVRNVFIERGLTRNVVNKYIEQVRRMYKWAVANKLALVETYQQLMTLDRLKKGRSKAPEGHKVRPLDQATIDATLAHVSPIVADMIRLQLATGMRPAEVCIIRPVDIDQSDPECWVYRPLEHMTEYLDKERTVAIGPRGQLIQRAYMLRAPAMYCFPPRETSGINSDRMGEHYTTITYRRAINRAYDKAGIGRWSPNRLRHTRGTEVRHSFGLEAAQATLGHSNAKVTEVDAERNLQLAKEVARRSG